MNPVFRTVFTVSLFSFFSCNSQLTLSDNIQQSTYARAYQRYTDQHQSSSRSEGTSDVCSDELGCLLLSASDRQGLEAIKSLHKQLDDDQNGAVDLSESDDFLREELQYESGAERRQKAFHRNDDMHISVKELWEAWIRSEVHNWTVEQTTEWLATSVGLPQYVPIFILNSVTGATLPRLAVSNMQYLSNVLGIKDPIHKQKIALKAMDVVLFGPPKDSSSYIKDIILITLLFGALIGCWYAYRMNKNSKRHLRRMMKDMESLHRAELALENLQKELERARQEQECATTEKQDLERRLLEQRGDSSEFRTSYSDLEVSQLKAEIEGLRRELQRAEGELEDRCWSPPVGLQQWLQLTHEIENKAHIKKKISAEKQLQSAREACEKLRKKRSSLVGAFVSTHGKSIDEVDRSIVEARTSLNEVTQELAERVHRWKQIEMLCGFNIINNNGLAVLESILYKGTSNGRGYSGLKGKMNSQDDLDDESINYSISSDKLTYESASVGGADSSGSEKQEEEEDLTSRSSVSSPVEFTVGGDLEDLVCKGKVQQFSRDLKLKMSLSVSQEMEPSSEHEVGSFKSQSESTLDSHSPPFAYPRQRRSGNYRAEPPGSSVSLEEEAYSTDSNSTVAEDSSSLDKNIKKNKIRFPKFTRKSRQTPPPPSEKHT